MNDLNIIVSLFDLLLNLRLQPSRHLQPLYYLLIVLLYLSCLLIPHLAQLLQDRLNFGLLLLMQLVEPLLTAFPDLLHGLGHPLIHVGGGTGFLRDDERVVVLDLRGEVAGKPGVLRGPRLTPSPHRDAHL